MCAYPWVLLSPLAASRDDARGRLNGARWGPPQNSRSELSQSRASTKRSTAGSTARAVFDDDALVFMLGQGAETLLAPTNRDKGLAAFIPRATPHATKLVMPVNSFVLVLAVP